MRKIEENIVKNVAIKLKPFCLYAVWVAGLGESREEPTEFSDKIVVNKHRIALYISTSHFPLENGNRQKGF